MKRIVSHHLWCPVGWEDSYNDMSSQPIAHRLPRDHLTRPTTTPSQITVLLLPFHTGNWDRYSCLPSIHQHWMYVLQQIPRTKKTSHNTVFDRMFTSFPWHYPDVDHRSIPRRHVLLKFTVAKDPSREITTLTSVPLFEFLFYLQYLRPSSANASDQYVDTIAGKYSSTSELDSMN